MGEEKKEVAGLHGWPGDGSGNGGSRWLRETKIQISARDLQLFSARFGNEQSNLFSKVLESLVDSILTSLVDSILTCILLILI